MILIIGIIFTSNLFLSSGDVVKAFTKLFPQAPANGRTNTTNTTTSQPLSNSANGSTGPKSSAVNPQLLNSASPNTSQQPNATLPRQLIISPSQLPNSTLPSKPNNSTLPIPSSQLPNATLPANITAHPSKLPTATTTPPPSQQQTTTIGFIAKGKINSIINTSTASWIASGSWIMNVDSGNVTIFDTNMTWFNNNGMTSHSHEFRNFKGGILTVQQASNDVFLKGVMDVGTNHRIVWKNVPTTISIHGGKTITISVADNSTNRHFAGQPILGLVNSFVPCSDVPGANMEVLPSCR
jgi:hypothetical protein